MNVPIWGLDLHPRWPAWLPWLGWRWVTVEEQLAWDFNLNYTWIVLSFEWFGAGMTFMAASGSKT